MISKPVSPGRTIHRVDLVLPIDPLDASPVFCTIPSAHNSRARLRPPAVADQPNQKTPTKFRSPARFKQLLNPPFVNLFVNVHTMTAQTPSTMVETVSNPSYRSRTLKSVSTVNKSRHVKDDSDQSRVSSDDRLLYDSCVSFDEQNKFKSKTSGMWQNAHHPQLTSTKALRGRRISKRSLQSIDAQLKTPTVTSIDSFSQVSIVSIHERLYERIEQLTKSYFPVVQQIRHSRPSAELINNRMHLHRVEEKNFMPNLSRTRAVR